MNILVIACGFVWSEVGGAQRVTADFSNAMVQRGHQVLVLFENKRQKSFFYQLDSRVQLCDLYREYGLLFTSCYSTGQKIIRECLHTLCPSAIQKWNRQCGLMAAKSKALNKRVAEFRPDIAISFSPSATVSAKRLTYQVPIVSMLHVDPTSLKNRDHITLNALAQVQNQVLLPYMKVRFREYIPNAKVEDIPNAVPQYEKCANLSVNKPVYKIVNVARLNGSKRQDLLVDSFARIAKKFPNWILELWGEDCGLGKLLQEKIRNYHLENQIYLRGMTTDVEAVYLNSDIFALTSPVEGFCLGLAEALSAGLPAVAFKECEAAAVLIQDGENGLLAAMDTEDFSNKLAILMKNQERRAEMGLAAHESMKQFSPQKVYDRWEALMRRVIKENAV